MSRFFVEKLFFIVKGMPYCLIFLDIVEAFRFNFSPASLKELEFCKVFSKRRRSKCSTASLKLKESKSASSLESAGRSKMLRNTPSAMEPSVSAHKTRYSIRFSNSRIFPGQSYSCRYSYCRGDKRSSFLYFWKRW